MTSDFELVANTVIHWIEQNPLGDEYLILGIARQTGDLAKHAAAFSNRIKLDDQRTLPIGIFGADPTTLVLPEIRLTFPDNLASTAITYPVVKDNVARNELRDDWKTKVVECLGRWKKAESDFRKSLNEEPRFLGGEIEGEQVKTPSAAISKSNDGAAEIKNHPKYDADKQTALDFKQGHSIKKVAEAREAELINYKIDAIKQYAKDTDQTINNLSAGNRNRVCNCQICIALGKKETR